MNFQLYKGNNKNILKLNILDEKICNYDCIFCPIGRGKKTDKIQKIDNLQDIINELNLLINNNSIDLIYINSMGEALIHNEIIKIIAFIKQKNIRIKLLSNGYILGFKEFQTIANLCDEIVGELKTINNEDFYKYQRPIENYNIETLINNMANFKKQYEGKFILEVTILNNINNDNESLEKLKDAINKINPDELLIEKETNDIFIKKYGITNKELEDIKIKLTNKC